ncbi:MAG: DUF4390 domain-containing protein [Chromatiaceae bacterium]|nr:DUF4390 domain-containing protein [Gammaproteobacteria bacterium]MCP5305324.1 DUF4390 domain-containing protein [Chromatiaceae bacterium]MCP5315283.1 DUF4390 domain-containing protein [Chromatiaceae bacterium]
MKRVARTIAVLLLCCLPAALFAEEVDFRRVALTLSEDGRILLDADITFDLNDTVSEALQNGVPLTFETHVQMRRADAWVWEPDVVEHRLRTVLVYRPLSGLYELRNLIGDERLSFATRDAALRTLGNIVAMPVVERSRLDLDEEYLVRLEVRLDIEALPLPMRPTAYLQRDWWVASEPWEWRLRP